MYTPEFTPDLKFFEQKDQDLKGTKCTWKSDPISYTVPKWQYFGVMEKYGTRRNGVGSEFGVLFFHKQSIKIVDKQFLKGL